MKLRATHLAEDSLALELAISADVVPTEFMILAKGRTETTKGPIVFSERSAKSVVERMAKLGRDRLNFDYGHGQLGMLQTAETTKSGGWFELDVRDGDLWAVNIEWTPTAEKGLSEREWRYFSPALSVTKTGEVVGLTNIALTNIPATIGQKPLIASDTPPNSGHNPKEYSMEMEVLLKLLGANTADEVHVNYSALQSENTALLATVKETELRLSASEERLVELGNAAAAAELAECIKELSTGKRPVLSPAMAKNWAPTQTVEQLKVYAASATPIVAGSSAVSTEVTAPAVNEDLVVLSENESKIAEMMGVSKEDFLATRKFQASQPHYNVCDPAKGPSAQESK